MADLLSKILNLIFSSLEISAEDAGNLTNVINMTLVLAVISALDKEDSLREELIQLKSQLESIDDTKSKWTTFSDFLSTHQRAQEVSIDVLATEIPKLIEKLTSSYSQTLTPEKVTALNSQISSLLNG